jgi:hypothetical protein
LADQFLISAGILFAHFCGHEVGSLAVQTDRVGDVELDRPAATRLEVDEDQPFPRREQVPPVWLAVQELLGDAAVLDLPAHASQRVVE